MTDVVIVGAGSAGCVLANRLSADPRRSVTLIEAGGSDWHPMLRMPSAFYMPVTHPRFNWGYSTDPEPHMNQRRMLCPRGRALGGSSSINGMVYVRGHPTDFDRWQAMGALGWSYSDVLPYFKKAQRFAGLEADNAFQGASGPLGVTNGSLTNPLYQMFLQAAQEAGYSLRGDLNDNVQEGFGPLPMTVQNGMRASAARAYLHPVITRNNLHLIRDAMVLGVELDRAKATGVRIKRGRAVERIAAGQVILCAGAINSPQLLMLSGIGAGADLRSVGVTVRHELPGVGQNLMDHLEIYVQQGCTKPLSLYANLSLSGRARIGLQWLLTRTGLGATNHFEAGGFVRSAEYKNAPDIQFHFLPAAMQYDGTAHAQEHGFQAHVGPMLSTSRGRVKLLSSDPSVAPSILFNYMSDAEDWRVFRKAIRTARSIFAQPAFASVRGKELRPGSECESDQELDAFIRAHAESAYHPCGTCRMGNDALSVVDPTGRVHGIDALRVVDASIFPHITNGNLNAPTIMLAERMADLIESG